MALYETAIAPPPNSEYAPNQRTIRVNLFEISNLAEMHFEARTGHVFTNETSSLQETSLPRYRIEMTLTFALNGGRADPSKRPRLLGEGGDKRFCWGRGMKVK